MKKISIIQPSPSYLAVNIPELWKYRELFVFLVWRDIKIRYKQTLLGASWAVIRPLISMVVFTFVFNRLAGFAVVGVPYPLFTLSGVLAWSFFSEGLTGSSASLIANTSLITKVYFPRLIIPSAAILRGFIDFFIGFVIFLALAAYFKFAFTLTFLLYPIVLIWIIITCLGLGLWFAAISVKYRDIAHALPFLVQLLFWITPVGYSSLKIPEKLQSFYWMNPMTGIIEASRYCLLSSGYLPLKYLSISILSSLFIFLFGIISFRRMEKEFSDII